MPRTSTVDNPGCPPLRALTFDSLGLIKVIEARGQEKSVPKVVETWGEPDSTRAIVAASIIDRLSEPLLGVARKNGLIEILSPVNGNLQASIPNASQTDVCPESDAIVGLHLFRKQSIESSSRLCTFLTCTIKGCTTMRAIEIPQSQTDSKGNATETTWNACGSGDILFAKVDESECYALFGGKGVEVNIWDLHTSSKLWNAKSPVKNSLGIFSPTWFTCASFLGNEDHRKFVSGTNFHQVRLYDVSAQRRPIMSFDFRETAIKSVAGDLDGHAIYVGNGSGDLASFDIRTGKLLGSFIGKCSGSIRSIVRHPELPVIASCGLDNYLRIWDINSRQLLSPVFLKQHLHDVVFDSYYRNGKVAPADLPQQEQAPDNISDGTDEGALPAKRKKASTMHKGNKNLKSRKISKNKDLLPQPKDFSEIPDRVVEEMVSVKRKKASKVHSGSDKVKKKNRKEQRFAIE
ncbi:WD repeat-containing protein DDB_G0290555-like isoform X2 [Coffea eugenioides]|uniref:WD repeat-containing protein DDB_G0290555-like isoform X2 n=1 Tax=Coffea eugenioides TaxID=49369 RepID=UPI000F60C323|nr:WD repeat-containing protein DDB_G0290555-like isoform X2 [Coffea eugenioides]